MVGEYPYTRFQDERLRPLGHVYADLMRGNRTPVTSTKKRRPTTRRSVKGRVAGHYSLRLSAIHLTPKRG
jgi:hypothetical protein